MAEKYDTYFHMHAAEGKLYVKEVLERTGDRPIEHLHKINALNHRVSMAHMTQLTPKEISYVAKAIAVVRTPIKFIFRVAFVRFTIAESRR